LLKDTKP